jgi:hypothetical protein
MKDTTRREAMSTAGKAMVDGLGARRVAQALLLQEMEEGV